MMGAATKAEASALAAYDTRPADVARERDRILALWREGLVQSHMPGAKYEWYYLSNPEGAPLVLFITCGGAEAGVACMGTRRMRLDGTAVSAGVLVDYVVAAEHRNFFAALHLQRRMRERGEAAHGLVFGFPNPVSRAVLRRLGYRTVGQLVRYTRVLRSSSYLERYLPAWTSRWLGGALDRLRMGLVALRGLGQAGYTSGWLPRLDERFDDLWRRAGRPGVLMGARDRAFLDWRFRRGPVRSEQVFGVLTRDGGRLAAYAICDDDDGTLFVRDFLSDPAQPGAARRLWTALAREAHRRGHRSLSTHFLGDPAVRRELREAGLLPRDERDMMAVVGARPELADEARWYVTFADVDE